jgi:hypothetical protein
LTDKEDISTEDIIKATELVRDLSEEEIRKILLANPLFKLLFEGLD